MASKKTIVKDDEFYKRVLNRSHKRFVEDLDTTPLLDLFIEKEFLGYPEVRDIQELRITSDKTREILRKVASRGAKGYKIFKRLLKISKQEHLGEYLDRQEADLEKKLMADEGKHDVGMPVKMQQIPGATKQAGTDMERVPDDRELIKISSHFGINWEMLGPFLGVPSTTVDQIRLDNSTTQMRVYRMFYVWRGMRGSEATIRNLLLDLSRAPDAVNIDWGGLEKTIQDFDRRKRQTDELPKQVSYPDQYHSRQTDNIPKEEGYLDQYHPYQSYDPSLEAIQGVLGRTRKTGPLQSNEYGPDLSGRSFPLEKAPGYVGEEGSKTVKGILSPSFKSFQNNPDVYQVYQVHESDVKKNQYSETGGTEADEEKSMERDTSQNIPGLPKPLQSGTQPESSTSIVSQGATGGSDFMTGREQQDEKYDDAHGDLKRINDTDEIDAARNHDVEKELANQLSRPLSSMKIGEKPGSNRRSGSTYVPPITNEDVPTRQPITSGGNDAASSVEAKEHSLLNKIAGNVKELQELKLSNKGNDNLDAGALPGLNVVTESEGGQAEPVAQDNRDFMERCNEERKRRVRGIFDSEDEIKGRLKVLSEENVEDLLALCYDKPIDNGGFGEIFVSKEKVPGIDLKLVLKKVTCEGDDAEHKLRSLTSEKLCARAMHFGIVPLFGMREDADKRVFYFLTPYMENGSLNLAIEKDNILIRKGEPPLLHAYDRLRIMFQIASAIDFLHTPILPDVRGMILHMDIKSLNIVLDKYLNARLIDFGLAREMKFNHDHTKTTSLRYFSTGGYDKLTGQQILERHDDYRCFGVVMRELLTGKKPSVEGLPEHDLKTQTENKLRRQMMGIWKKLEVTSSLVTLSTNCIDVEKGMTSEHLLKELKTYLAHTNTKRWISPNDKKGFTKRDMPKQDGNKQANNTNQTGEETMEKDVFIPDRDVEIGNKQTEKCDMCLTYNAVEESLLQHIGCVNQINVCVSCMRNSYCNPIHCHSCDTDVTPTIGHNWAALLVSGYHEMKDVVKIFKEDVDAIKKVITSKCPLVMGISTDDVQTVCPDENINSDDMLNKLEMSVNALQGIKGLQTLLVYYSGHYKPDKGGFELVNSKHVETGIRYEEKYLSVKGFEEVITKILNGSNSTDEQLQVPKRAIIFLDCCAAPAITPSQEQQCLPGSSGDAIQQTKLPCFKLSSNVRIVQINACRPDQSISCQKDGSIFRKFLVQCLTREALGDKCLNLKCNQCRIEGDFVTVEKMLKYLGDHIENHSKMEEYDPVMNTYNVSKLDAKIGYVVNFKVDLRFILKFSNQIQQVTVPQRMFTELRELQILLFDEFVDKMKLDEDIGNGPKLDRAEFNGIICIEVEKGPKSHQRDRLDTLDRVMTAWNAKRELLVTLRTLSEIFKGMVGIFLPSGRNVDTILEYLKKNTNVKMISKDYATVISVDIKDNFSDFLTDLESQDTSTRPALDTFLDHICDIDDVMVKDNNSKEKELVKELHIVFPCKTNERGEKTHRSNFICYQLKREADLH